MGVLQIKQRRVGVEPRRGIHKTKTEARETGGLMPIPVFYGIGITLPVVLDFLLLVDPLVHRGLVHGLGLFDKWRCADLHSNGEFVCLFTEGCVRGNDRAQVRGRRRERGRQGLEDSLNVLRKLGSCGLQGGKGQSEWSIHLSGTGAD